uniref:Uncharacterized protein n=1 Tax=Setaria viridis TaxID=4556 RepID=A0A4U6VZP4_SETVI|nr:hypothetical protein SEVIR_2G246450v2 [Setaria viridis]
MTRGWMGVGVAWSNRREEKRIRKGTKTEKWRKKRKWRSDAKEIEVKKKEGRKNEKKKTEKKKMSDHHP